MDLGIKKGDEIGKTRDGDKDRRILQVEIIADDVRPVEMISQAGEDTNPADGCRVLVLNMDGSYSIGVAVTDDLLPEVDVGEKEIYSTDNPATQKLARIKFNKDSELELNGDTDFAVRFSKLKEVIDELQSDIADLKNVIGTTWVVVPTDGGAALKAAATTWAGTALTKNIDDSKIDEIKVPEAP